MLALSSPLLFPVAFDTYRLGIKRNVMQKSDKNEQKPTETQGDLQLVQQRVHSMHFTKTGWNA